MSGSFIEIWLKAMIEGLLQMGNRKIIEPFTPENETMFQSGYNVSESLNNFRNREEYLNQIRDIEKQMQSLEDLKGLYFYGGRGKEWEQKMKDLTEELDKFKELVNSVDFGKIKEAFGIDINSIASALENAFQSDNYMDFLNSWSQNLEQITRTALIRAFLATDKMQGFYQNLGDMIWKSMEDGVVSNTELDNIKSYSHSMDSITKDFYNVLNKLGLNDTSGSGGSGGSQTYTAGSSVPIVYNNYITIEAGVFMGDEDQARQVALYLQDFVVAEEGRG
jgi:hypothetical protein